VEANDFEVRIASTTNKSSPGPPPNATLTAYLIHYDAARFSIEISLQKQQQQQNESSAASAASASIHFDPFYDFNRSKQAERREAASLKSTSNSSQFPSAVRHLSHPAFKAVSRGEAEALLESMPVGEVLLRPASQRRQLAPQVTSDFALSWRLAPGIYQHLPLGEADRLPGQDWLLGRSLFLPAISSSRSAVALDRFEDVDEIVARRLEPVLGLLQEACVCPKYFESHGNMDAIKAHLRSQSAVNPARIPYCISLGAGGVAGSLLLSHPSGHEVLGVDPRGFILHCGGAQEEKTFERIDGLVEYFKRNYKEFERKSEAAAAAELKDSREDPRNKYQQFA
jgi:hypothetical protein